MLPITIKRRYHEKTREILKQIKPYTYDINDYTIVMMVKKESPFNSFYFEIRWVDYTKKDYPKHNIPIATNPMWISEKVISEVIESLTLAKKDIHYELEYYY